MRNDFAHEVEGRPKGKIDRALEIFALHVGQRPDFDHARIVDQHIDGAETINDFFNRRLDLRTIE